MSEKNSFFIAQKDTDNALVDENGLTGLITYNVKDTGRTLTQTPRKYNIRGVYELLNSKTVQEGIKNGDYFGYFGHWIRELLGLDPLEGGFIDGKLVLAEPALSIKQISADLDGNVSFKVQFLDTPMGNMAKRVYKNKKGGFSIVWDYAVQPDGSLLPYLYYGTDFVLNPNFTKSRGYAMDAAKKDFGMVAMDSTDLYSMGEYIKSILTKNAALEADNKRLQADNDNMVLSMARGTAFDSAKKPIPVMPTLPNSSNLLANSDDFLTANLASYQEIKKEQVDETQNIIIQGLTGG
ncbi:MAG: hypothetical protein IPM57_10720 [Oligoflexia bacterium]|nr:hypothetical protein [Oligoflexia bacterium]